MEAGSSFRHCHVSTKVHDVTRKIVTLYWPVRPSWYRASWYVSIIKPTRRTIFEFTEHHSTCFGLSSRPSSGVLDSTHSIVYVILVSWLLASGHEMELHFLLVPASKQSTNQYDIYPMLFVLSRTPDDGRKDRPKHVDWYSVNSKIVHLFGFTTDIYIDRCENFQPCTHKAIAVLKPPFPATLKSADRLHKPINCMSVL